MLYSVLLVSAMQPRESTLSIHTPPHSDPPSHLTPPILLGCHRAPPLQVVPVLNSNFPVTIYFQHGDIYISVLFSQFMPPSPSPAVSTVCSLHLCLYSCPANRFISTIFLDSIYMCVYVNIQYLFFSTSLFIAGSIFICLTGIDSNAFPFMRAEVFKCIKTPEGWWVCRKNKNIKSPGT